MKIFFAGVFTKNSTSNSQARALRDLGYQVYEYDFRERKKQIGSISRDYQIIEKCQRLESDLLLIAKGDDIKSEVLKECNKFCKTILWYMDPAPNNPNWNQSLFDKFEEASAVVCDKKTAYEASKKYNPISFRVCEGFDETVDFKWNIEKDIDTSFIGNLYGERANILKGLGVEIFNNAYGRDHSQIVSRSRVNINLCTDQCASDRVYKIMAAGGFLLTDKWIGHEDFLSTSPKDQEIVIFEDRDDLIEKIKYYLENEQKREEIAARGHQIVQKMSRLEWAKGIIDTYDFVKSLDK